MSDMATAEYRELLNNESLGINYRNCLKEFVDEIIMHNLDNIRTVLLYGGLVRDGHVFDAWSDIDVAVIFHDIVKRDPVKLAALLNRMRATYSIRIDLTQLSLDELCNNLIAKALYNSEIINALSMRENVSIIMYGSLPPFKFTIEQERSAAIFYLSNTRSLFRRYLVEVLYKNSIDSINKNDIMRIIRWTFSIIRSSLRLFNIFSHPYEYSLPHVHGLFPYLDLSHLNNLIDMRKDINSAIIGIETVQQTELFIENYIPLVLKKYYGESDHEKNG